MAEQQIEEGETMDNTLHYDSIEEQESLVNAIKKIPIEEILKMYYDKDEKAHEKGATYLIISLKGYILQLIKETYPTYVEEYMNDLYAWGLVGVLEGMKNYSKEKGQLTTFLRTYIIHEISAYITKYIHQSTPHYVKQAKEIKKVEKMFEESGEDFTDHDVSRISGIRLETIYNTRQYTDKTIAHIEASEVDFYSASSELVKSAEDAYLEKEIHDTVTRSREMLSPMQQKIVALLFDEGYSIYEAAEILEIPIYHVRKLREESLKKLRREIMQEYDKETSNEYTIQGSEIIRSIETAEQTCELFDATNFEDCSEWLE